jgi:hypothetical protein
MPKPKGWTDAMLVKRDQIKDALRDKGVPESRAYAIATARVEEMMRKEGHPAFVSKEGG